MTRSGPVLNERQNIKQNFPLKSISGVTFCWVIWPVVTFGENFSSTFTSDTGLKFLMSRGRVYRQSDKQTFEYCNID
jgi:hypothetical protein